MNTNHNNMKLHAIIVPVEEEKFADIEQGVDTTTAKSIIRNVKSSQELEAENEIKIRIVKIVSILFISIFASPFIICDLIFGYSDDSCVDTYPENLNLVNMKTYLLVNAYYTIGFLTILFINLCFISEKKFFEVLNYKLEEIPKTRWVGNPNLSSGVGQQISLRLYNMNLNMYHTKKSFVYHGNHESKMNKVERVVNNLTTN